MAAKDYTGLAKTALRSIDRFGTDATLRRITPGAGPAHNPGPGTATNYAVRMVFDNFSMTHREGTLIQAGDKRVYIAARALSIRPEPGDMLIDDEGAVWAVVQANVVKPGGVALLYDCQVRR